MIKEILSIFEQNKGFLCSNEISHNQRYYLDKMIRDNLVRRIRKGVFILNNNETYDEKVILSKILPMGVFCLFSAWDYYGLTTSIPSKHYIALGRKTKVKEIDYPPTQLFYWTDNFYKLGVTEIYIDNKTIRIYDIEKSICDAVRFRSKVGEDITIEVVKNYIKTKDKNIDKLMKYANTLRIKKSVEQYIKPLL
jgi:predicted transcriptional regulator of viral defense system